MMPPKTWNQLSTSNLLMEFINQPHPSRFILLFVRPCDLITREMTR